VTGCERLGAVAAELALGLLSGDERAEALAHTETCPACRSLVDDLAGTADALVLAGPRVEPTAGFEQRVVNAIRGDDSYARARTGNGRRWIVVAVAAAVAVVALAGAAYVGRLTAKTATHEVAKATMVTADDVAVGNAFVVRGDLGLVFVDVPRWRHGDGDYYVQLGFEDGTKTELEATSIEGAPGSYAASVDGAHARVVDVALVDANGRVLCSAAIPA
jgi:hypothetical protein